MITQCGADFKGGSTLSTGSRKREKLGDFNLSDCINSVELRK
jgi:hypothetical protein